MVNEISDEKMMFIQVRKRKECSNLAQALLTEVYKSVN